MEEKKVLPIHDTPPSLQPIKKFPIDFDPIPSHHVEDGKSHPNMSH